MKRALKAKRKTQDDRKKDFKRIKHETEMLNEKDTDDSKGEIHRKLIVEAHESEEAKWYFSKLSGG